MSNIPIPLPIPLGTEAYSVTVSGIRRALQNRNQNQSFLGFVKKTPTYEELREKELKSLQISNGRANGIEMTETFVAGKIARPEFNSPSQRIDRGLYIIDLVTTENIKIQFVPESLDYNPESRFIPIASMARNNPLYHYTGSEDTLKFTLDWFAEEDSREDVLSRCKKLEALTKNDGFDNPPHHVKLLWNNKMFSEAEWVVTSAPYKLTQFQAHKNMLPQQAIQEVTLKRIVANNIGINGIRNLNF